jgi:SAM-dependent methyltransferase
MPRPPCEKSPLEVHSKACLFESYLVDDEGWGRWLHEIRRLEFEGTMGKVPLGRRARVLELGSGDGFQLDLLRDRFERVLAIDPLRAPADGDGFVFAHAEALPFSDESFDLVFSSNVLEHLQDRRRAVKEAVRVLRPGGYMAHVVPSRFWKAASLLLHPLCQALHLAGKWSLRRRQRLMPGQASEETRALQPTPAALLKRCFCPEVHGTFPSHRGEFRAYGKGSWRQILAHRRLELMAEVRLLAYSPFGLLRPRLVRGRLWLARHGMSSVHGFVFRKIP